jgi:hypothetical protein
MNKYAEFYNFVKHCPDPLIKEEFLKIASLSELESPVPDPANFADPHKRLLPIHNPKSIIFSGYLFKKYASKLYHSDEERKLVLNNLKTAAAKNLVLTKLNSILNDGDYGKIEIPSDEATSRKPKSKKKAPKKNEPEETPDKPIETFPVTRSQQSGDKCEKCAVISLSDGKQIVFPLESTDHVNKVAQYLIDNRSHIPFAFRRYLSRKVLERLTEFKKEGSSKDLHINIDMDAMCKMAGLGTTTKEDLLSYLITLFNFSKTYRSHIKLGYIDKLRSIIRYISQEINEPFVPIKTLNKIATALDKILVQLNIKEGDALPYLEDVLFKLTKPYLIKFSHQLVTLTDGTRFSLKDIYKLKPEDIRKIYSMLGFEDISKEASSEKIDMHQEFVEIIKTLPRTDVPDLVRILKKLGIMPV